MDLVFRHRSFGLLWWAGLISTIGDWVLFAALPFAIYQLTGSALATGGMFIVSTLPRLIFGSVAGVFVDRWDRRQTMIVADLLRATLLLALLTVRSADSVGVVYVVAFVEATLSQFFAPAKSALVPDLVDEQDLLAANSLAAVGDNLPRLIGPSLGGTLMGVFGLGSVVLMDSASYLISGLLLLFVVVPKVARIKERATRAGGAAWVAVWSELRAGLTVVRESRLLRSLFVVVGVAMIAEGFITVLFVPFVTDVVRAGPVEFGWMMTARGVGGLLGGVVVGGVGRLLLPSRLVGLSGVLAGLIFGAITAFPLLAVVLGFLVLLGVPAIGFFVSVQTMLQVSVRDDYRGRVFGAFGTFTGLLTLVGMGLASGLGGPFGAVPVLEGAAALYAAAGLVALRLLGAAAAVPGEPLAVGEPA